METKILKAKCTQTNKKFALELQKIGGDWKVTNMDTLPDEVYDRVGSEIRQPAFYTHDALLPCLTCGSRKVGGCRCSPSRHACSAGMKYRFDCVYCDRFEIDYKRSRGGPYNAHAGISNIPGAIKDSYGNPQGSEYDLAADGSFAGYKIVVLNLCNECSIQEPRKALEKKGFTVVEYTYASVPSVQVLSRELAGDKTQLWLISHRSGFLGSGHIQLIEDYFNSGHGVYIWGDNDPYYVDANEVLSRLFNARLSGNSMGDQVLGIQTRSGAPGIIRDHLITTGIVNFFEGITISAPSLNGGLLPLMYASDGRPVTAYYDADGKRALVDGGFTRLWYKWDSAGTDRYVVNAACWLANVERFGYEGN